MCAIDALAMSAMLGARAPSAPGWGVEAGRPTAAAAAAIVTEGNTRTLMHVATDWPGHYPWVAATIAKLLEAGADVNGRASGSHTETPLHWAASSDDVDALDALLDAGADIEADGAVIAGGTPLDDAVAFGQWHTARRLVERGAYANLFNAAASGWRRSAVGLVEQSPGDCLLRPEQGGQHKVREHQATAGHLMLRPPRIDGDTGPPAGLVVADGTVGVGRIGHMLAGQILMGDHRGAGFLSELTDQGLRRGFPRLDGATRECPPAVVPRDHHHPAFAGEADTQRLSDPRDRRHPAGPPST